MRKPNMTHESCDQDERISALADGELRGEEFAQVMTRLAESEQARRHWQAYHLVGDVLRSSELARTAAQDSDFVLRLRARLQAESTLRVTAAPSGVMSKVPLARGESANGQRWRWVAGLASLAALSVVGWQLVADLAAPAQAPQLAQFTAPLAGGAYMIRDPRLDQLLAAHQQVGGTSALQMPAGFLRNATFERPGR
jgi:sigma-E factor negative regulatory protein RseA